MSKIKQIIDKIINEQFSKLLTEKFMSPKLGKFAQELGKFKNYDKKSTKLLKGVAWDKIPDSEVIFLKTDSDQLKKYVNDPSYIILWFAGKKQTIQYKPTTYLRYGSSQDNSTYLQPGRLIVTQGREFLYGYSNLQTHEPAKDKYQKPYYGKLSVLALSTKFNANALIISKSTLEQFSTTDLMASRKDSKSGATALMKVSDILSSNQERYRKAIRDNKFKTKTASTDKLVTGGLDKLKVQIEQASKINFDDLVTYAKPSYQDKANLDVPTVKQIDMTKLIELTKLYKDIVYQYDRYLKYAGNGSDWESETESAKKELEQMIAKIGA